MEGVAQSTQNHALWRLASSSVGRRVHFCMIQKRSRRKSGEKFWHRYCVDLVVGNKETSHGGTSNKD